MKDWVSFYVRVDTLAEGESSEQRKDNAQADLWLSCGKERRLIYLEDCPERIATKPSETVNANQNPTLSKEPLQQDLFHDAENDPSHD